MMMNKIKKTEIFITDFFKSAEGAHDLHHTLRVRDIAMHIARKENADLFVVNIASLLHDVDDWKLGKSYRSSDFLDKIKIDKKTKTCILDIIENLSYKGAKVKTPMSSLEGKIVQDADRLDAIGAVGIARVFAYGSVLNKPIYDKRIKPIMHKTFSDYKKAHYTGTSINHFYEKLLLLKDRMNTKTGKRLAIKRHKFMLKFLDEFYHEVNFKG